MQKLKTNDCAPLDTMTRTTPRPNLLVLPSHSTHLQELVERGLMGDRMEEWNFRSGSHVWNGRGDDQKARRKRLFETYAA